MSAGNKERLTIVLDPSVIYKLRKKQAKLQKESITSVSLSSVIEEILEGALT